MFNYKYFKIRYLFIVILLTSFSCFPVKHISIEVLKPAKITLPSEIKSVSLISAKNEENTSPGELKYINNIRLDKDINYHSISWDYLYGIKESLINSPRFEKVVVSSVNLFDFYSSNDYNWNDLIKITRADTTDAIFILEDYYLNDSLTYGDFYENYYVNLSLKNYYKWTILYPKLLITITLNSTGGEEIYWERIGHDHSEAISTFPKSIDMLRESAYAAGITIGPYIAPTWKENESRNFFISGNKLIRSGVSYADQDNWEKAAEYWDEASFSQNRKTAAKASYNLALAYELQDDLDMAKEMIELSDSLYSTTFSRIYKKKISQRLKERELLDTQMNISE